MTSLPIQQSPSVEPAETLEEQFRRLADEWYRAVAHHSSDRIRNNHPAYQAIIGLGRPVVPLLLRDLEVNGRHWFAALRALTGANPVPSEDAGSFSKMVEAWLSWGREQGYQC